MTMCKIYVLTYSTVFYDCTNDEIVCVHTDIAYIRKMAIGYKSERLTINVWENGKETMEFVPLEK